MFPVTTKILIADDMMTMRVIVKKNLIALGYSSFAEAKDGQEAWDQLQRLHSSATDKPVQLILSDWNMPNVSGLDFLKKVRADDRFRSLPFLLITAESEQTQIVEAVKAGVTHYIVKPFTPEVLKERLAVAYAKMTGKK